MAKQAKKRPIQRYSSARPMRMAPCRSPLVRSRKHLVGDGEAGVYGGAEQIADGAVALAR
jgi:hypothetical protein